MEVFDKELHKQLFKPMDVQELQNPKKVSAICVKSHGSIIKKMNNTKSSIVSMKSKDAIKLDSVRLDKTYPEKKVLPQAGLYRYLPQLREQHGDQKRRAADLNLHTE